MKINTKEKLEILMFGLYAGYDLKLQPNGTVKKCAIFSSLDDEDINFYLAEDGAVTASAEDLTNYNAYYQALGCIEHSKQKANKLFSKIK